jgi:small-conductance mechanosensitive channel
MTLAHLLPVLAQQASPSRGLFDPTTQVFSVVIPLPPWSVILIGLGAGVLFHFVVRGLLVRWAAKTDTDLDDMLVSISGKVVPLWVFLSLAFVTVEMLNSEGMARLRAFGFGAIGLAFLLSLYWAISTLLLDAVTRWAARNPQFQPVFPPVRFVLKTVLVVVSGVSALAFLNVDVSALLATLGVGGLAVALALKDTLENFFAGLHVMADRPVREGDWITVHDSGVTGSVIKVGWRSTRIRTLDNNVLVIPNLKLASGLITNLTILDSRLFVRIQVGVSYDADPDRVAALLEEEARAGVGSIPGLVVDPPPVANLHPGFGPSSLDFTLRATASSMEDASTVQDLLRRRVLLRLRKEGIAIPYPVTTVRVEKPAE